MSFSKPAPSRNLPTPEPGTTTPGACNASALALQMTANGNGSRPAAPDMSNGPPIPSPGGKQPGKPKPNSNGADSPSLVRNPSRSP
jgi:hypothetical protein